MRLKLLFVALAFFVVCGRSYGQLLQWNTFGNAGTEITEPSVFNDTNISVSNLTQGTITAAGNANRFGGSNWFNTGNTAAGNTMAEAVAGNDYIQFVVTPNSGYSFTPTSLNFIWDFSGTGPKNLTLRSSVDNYTADLGTLSSMTANTSVFKTITISGLNTITTATTFRIYGYGATATGGTGGFDVASNGVNVELNGTTASTGPTSITSGDWNVSSTWSPGSVPTSTDNVTISTAHTVYTSASLTRTGTTTVNGGFQLNEGGWASGTTFTYGASGTLNFNKSSGSYGVSNTDVFWPTTSSPFNVNILQGGVTLNSANRTVAGTFATASGVTLSSSTLTLNGTAQINGGGFFNQSPIYGNTSTLKYNTGGTYGRGNEWTVSAGTIGITSGYPNDVQVSNNTLLNLPNTGNFGNDPSSTSFGLARDLTVDIGSNFAMDYGLKGNKSGSVTVGRNINIAGSLSLGDAIGGDLFVGGNWTRTGTFTPKSRLVTFNASLAQTLTGETNFDYLTLANSLGLTLQASSAVTVNQTLNLTSGKITIGANNLTVGSAGTITGNSSSNYVVTSSTGKLIRQSIGNTATTFPVGFSSTNYTPVTITNTTGISDLSLSVKQSVTNAVTDATRIVTLEWGITSSAATTSTISPIWIAATPINQAATFTNIGTGEIGNFTTAYTTYPVTLSTTTTTATGIALQSGTNLIVVGNTGDVYTVPPANDLCTNAIALTLNATATNGNLKGSTPTAGLTYSVTSKDVWYSFTPSCTGTFAITVTGYTGDVDMDVFTTICPTLGIGTSTSHGSTATETVSASLISGTTYFIRILGFDVTAAKSAFTIQVTNSGLITIANTGSPSEGNIMANTNDVVLFGFNLTPNACTTNYDFTQVVITKTGTLTTSDLSNFRIVYDGDGDGVLDVGESFVSGLGIALANSMTFTMSGQTGFSAARKYLLVADVAVLATGGNTFRASISPSTNLTATLTPIGAVTGTATGNIQTIIYNGPEINVTNNTPSSIPTASNASNGYNTVFAGTVIGFSTASKTYRIYNLGSTILNVSSVTSNNTEFAVVALSSYAIAPAAYITFTVTFLPLNIGTRTAVISIANNDVTNDGTLIENPYTFNLEGTGNCPTTTNTITPTSGPVGTEVTITSSNSATNNLIGATAAFNGVNAIVTQISSSQVTVLVPSGATSGNLVVTNATDCQATNAFTVIDNKANTCQGGTIASDLFITEVTDSNSGGLTYVEIYNGTGTTVNLSAYHIDFYNNGSLTQNGGTVPFGNVNLLSGNTFTIAVGVEGSPYTNTCSGQNDQYNGSRANLLSGISGVNFKTGGENDHIKLFKSATQIDSWGMYNNGNWANGLGIGTEGATFRRKNTASLVQPITYANSDWDITDWTDCANSDYSNIGTYNFIAGTPPAVTTPSYTANCKTATVTVSGTEGFAGGNTLTYQWLVSAPNASGWTDITNDSNYSGASSATLSIANISTVINYQYYCQIRENTNTCYSASNAVKITDGGTTTWNGAWTNGPPTIDKLVILNANYNTSIVGLDSFSACSVVVNSPYTLNITANKYVKIQNDLTNYGTVTIENGGSLVQVNDAAVNSGNIRYERDYTGISTYDYTYWSSPVASQNLLALSPTTKLDKFYSFDAEANVWKPENPITTTMEIGKGYIIRAAPITGFPPGWLTNSFIGVPYNGEKIVPIFWNGDPLGTSNLIGNPYPSAIDAVKFLTANTGVIESTIYFWTNATSIQNRNLIIGNNPDGTPKAGTGELAYTTDDYASFNLTGGVATGNIIPGTPPTEVVSNKPNGKIAAGQAFFTTSLLANGTATFNNSMRLSSTSTILDNSQFFKTRNPKTKTAAHEKHRIWLNLTNTQGAFKQTLIGYITDATNQYDSRFDGESFDGNEFVDFYSVNQDKNLVIQGRALPFDENDEVPLGFRTLINGDFTIKIDQADGLLTNQAVFIEDKLTNATFDLRRGPFTFNTVAGTFNDRFVLRYTDKSLGTIDLETRDNLLVVSNKNKQIKVNSKVESIDKVMVYDLLGRLLFKKDKVNSTELSILNLISNAQTILIKVTLQNGTEVTKKVIY